jgi:hypothetical protein
MRQQDLEKCEPQSQHGSGGSAYFIARATQRGHARRCHYTVEEHWQRNKSFFAGSCDERTGAILKIETSDPLNTKTPLFQKSMRTQ